MKTAIKKVVPPRVLNHLLLKVPQLYPLLRYGSQLSEDQLTVLFRALEKDLPGDIIECGAYVAGTTILMAQHLQAKQIPKTIYAFDSFAGFAREEIQDEIHSDLVRPQGSSAFTENSFEHVQKKIEICNLQHMITLVPGYFEQTLNTVPGPFSLAVIDCDLEKSVEFCLQTLWEKVVPGGCVVVDDYSNPGYPGARIACDRFLKEIGRDGQVQHGLMVIEK